MKKLKYISSVVIILITVFGIYFLFTEKNLIYSANGIKVYTIGEKNIKLPKDNLTYLSESEIINNNKISIYRGIIKEINNIKINFKREKEYAAILNFYVTKTIKGDSKNGKMIKILLPAYNFGIVDFEDSEAVSKLKEGTECIVMPYKYVDDELRIENESLKLREIAEYGFLDNQRYIFSSCNGEIFFCKSAFPSLKNVSSLEEIEVFIKQLAFN